MAKQCCVCGINTIFYIWSSSRDFPRELLLEKLNTNGDNSMSILDGSPVCISCYNKLINNE